MASRGVRGDAERRSPVERFVNVRASYTYTRANDNSTYSCCTANEGFTGQRYGALGPNAIGGIGDDRGWGPSNFVRDHAIVLSGMFRVPFGIRVSPKWRIRSGTPWGPEVNGDINGDGVLSTIGPSSSAGGPAGLRGGVGHHRDSVVAVDRARYADILAEHECVATTSARSFRATPATSPGSTGST